MRLTQFSDYSLRTLIYLDASGDRFVPVGEVARGYGISYHHLVKVAAFLVDLGVAESLRGRGGGLRLAKRADQINLGWLVRRTEPDFNLVECFDRANDSCPITRVCYLKHVLRQAERRFLETLDAYTLADLVQGDEGALLCLTRASG
jgi:Rrf2 family nitric oxide-sensitive transcriptional repressor